MINDYVTMLVVEDRLAGFRREAELDRLARLVRAAQPRRRRWWERLMLFRSRPVATESRPVATPPRAGAPRAAATVAASESPC